MNWKLRIYTTLNLGDKSPKVISDHTNVLSSIPFLSYLDENKVQYIVADKLPEMLSASGNKNILVIITGITDVPAFITNKYFHRHFTFSDIPLNGEIASLLKSLSANTIIELLNFVFATNPHTVITNHNLQPLLSQSVAFASLAEIQMLETEINSVLTTEPTLDSILLLAKQWGKLIYLSCKQKQHNYLQMISQVDAYSEKFFLSEKISEVFFASTPKNPKTVAHILPNIKAVNLEKIALLCFDCLGWAEWFLLKDFISNLNLVAEEKQMFAMLPSVTSVSRSAIFHGSRDVYNITSPGRNDEAKSFQDFFSSKQTKYFTEQDEISENTLLGYNYISILYTFFDDLCHSAQFPPNEKTKELYFDAVQSYLAKSQVINHLQTLLSNGFAIYCCSDHGSVVAVGNGQKVEKYLLDSFAKRACVISNSSSELTEFKKMQIPFVDDKIMVLPEGRTMFTTKGYVEINHGGISVEEAIVPYIKLK